MLIDSHVNLHAPQFDEDREAVIHRARAAGVQLMVNICDKVSNFPKVRALADEADIWCTVGTHPHEAKEDPDLSPATLADLARDPRVVGIGECGLDFHYDLSPRDIQAAVFRAHVAAARETGLPLVVHTREADAVMGAILEEEYARGPFRLHQQPASGGRSPQCPQLLAPLQLQLSDLHVAGLGDDARSRSLGSRLLGRELTCA
jgi:TatD DNase family protein